MSGEGSNDRALLQKTIVECMVMFAMRACATTFFVTAALLSASAQLINSPHAPVITPGKFTDITAAAGVRFQHVAPHTSRKYLIETMAPGVALFDFDNDGRLDIFVTNGAPISDPTPKGTIPQKTGPEYWNRLYHQKPDGTFEDVTEKAGLQGVGYGMGVAVGDYDNDGYEDLFVTAYGGNRLYHNNGNGTFTDVTRAAGVGGSGWSTSAAWVDLDNDGLLDLVVVRYIEWDFSDIWCGPPPPGLRSLLPSRCVSAHRASRLPQRRQRPLHRSRAKSRPVKAGQGPGHRPRRLRSRRPHRHLHRQRFLARVSFS